MKILFLSNNDISKSLFNRIKNQNSDIDILAEKITNEDIQRISPDLIISYNYRHIIKKEVLDLMTGKIINLHISLLPWNRGANPNFWSFVEDSPKGVTIHFINEAIDRGDILFQKEVKFNEEIETLNSTYQKLNAMIQHLFIENWNKIKELNFNPAKQTGTGTYHTIKDFEKINYIIEPEGWNIKISELRKRYYNMIQKHD